MTFKVVHRTEYRYDREVFSTYGEARLHPRELTGQRCYSTTLSVDPFPEEYRVRKDFFGNRVAHYAVLEPHTALVVTATSVVDVRGRQMLLPSAGGHLWETVRADLRTSTDPEVLDARQFTMRCSAKTALESRLSPRLWLVSSTSHRVRCCTRERSGFLPHPLPLCRQASPWSSRKQAWSLQ